VRGGGKAAHVGPGLGDDHLGGVGGDAGDRAEQVNRLRERGDFGLHLGIEPADRGGEVVDVVQQGAQHQRVVVAEPALEGQP
jgi:hypothetical protein